MAFDSCKLWRYGFIMFYRQHDIEMEYWKTGKLVYVQELSAK